MTSRRPAVWFERPALAELAAEVAATCFVIGAGHADDPNAGLEAAQAP